MSRKSSARLRARTSGRVTPKGVRPVGAATKTDRTRPDGVAHPVRPPKSEPPGRHVARPFVSHTVSARSGHRSGR